MKIEVNLNKKYAFMILGAILILAGAFVAIAYGTNNPAVFGHSVSEIEGSGGGVRVAEFELYFQVQNDGASDRVEVDLSGTMPRQISAGTGDVMLSTPGANQSEAFVFDSVSHIYLNFGLSSLDVRTNYDNVATASRLRYTVTNNHILFYLPNLPDMETSSSSGHVIYRVNAFQLK